MQNPFELIDNRLSNIETLLKEIRFKKTEEPNDFSKAQFSKLIDKSQSWIDSERRAGRLDFFRRGGTVRIPSTELKKYQG